MNFVENYPHLLMKPHILWDFNGTIVNDVDLCVEIMNELLAEKHLPLLTKNTYKEYFCFPVKKYYTRIGIVNNDEEFEDVSHQWMEKYYAKEHLVKVFDNVEETMHKIKNLGIKQGVLSVSRQDQLERMLHDTKLDTYMDVILGAKDIYAKSKAYIGLNFIESNSIDPSDILMIGDSVHDFEVATEMQINCLLCSNGHQSYNILKESHHDVIDDLAKIFETKYFK